MVKLKASLLVMLEFGGKKLKHEDIRRRAIIRFDTVGQD